MVPMVIRVPRAIRRLLGRIPRWKETLLLPEARISQHSHRFMAIYFTFGVRFLNTATGTRPLPAAAIVIVPAGVEHGWSGTSNAAAIVGHFHVGHLVHVIENLKPASA
jgi:quercetin dioxygenase-like cupin family protein